MRPEQTSAAGGATAGPGSPVVRTKHTLGPPLPREAVERSSPQVGPDRDALVLLRAISAAARAEEQSVSLGSFLCDGSSLDEPPSKTEGMTIREAAEWLGVDHRTLARHLTIVPPGPVPVLPPGKVPARLIGDVRRIFKADVLGLHQCHGGAHEHRVAEAPSSSRWHRQVDQLRQRGSGG